MIYTLGLIFAISIILISWDDFIWDIFYLLKKYFGKNKIDQVLSLDEIESLPPKMMALIIAAYREEDVIEEVIENLMRSTQYPLSMFHLFVGVYPNDPDTTAIIHELEKKYPNVHAIIHVLDGPSSKADNINNVIENIKIYQKDHDLSFKFLVVHDSEDVIHPYEFLYESYLMKTHQVVQMPVFPLLEKPTWQNIFKNMITSTYVDEFAENHYRMMPIRNSMNAFVPSAGTGFAIRWDVVESYPDSNIFPKGSLTEDYKLSLQFKQKGIDVYYPLESVSKFDNQGLEHKEYIATRSMFPKTYKAAVRQKARWIHGITMQSFDLKDILLNKELSLITRYSFYKDWKAKFGNLLILPAYLIFIYFISSLIFDIPIMYPKYSASWYIMLVLTFLMLQRQFWRFQAVFKVYGLRSAAVAVLFPPLMPARMVVGNVINLHATLRAWRHHLFGQKKTKDKKVKKVKWSKTDHEFLSPDILLRYHRMLEDKLLERLLVSPENLKLCRDIAYEDQVLLRLVLKDFNVVPELDLIKAVSQVDKTQFYTGPLGNYIFDQKLKDFDLEKLKVFSVLPLYTFEDHYVFIGLIDSDWEGVQAHFSDKKIKKVFTTEEQLLVYQKGEKRDLGIQNKLNKLERCIQSNKIQVKQALIAMRYTEDFENLIDTFDEMGVLTCEKAWPRIQLES